MPATKLRLTASGAAIGVVVAFILTRYLKSELYGVEASDPIIFSAVSASLMTMALVASFVPALRALQIEPLAALRHE